MLRLLRKDEMTIRRLQILTLGLLLFYGGCRAPQKAELRTFFPPGTLVYAETEDLSRVVGVFTGNRDWKSLSGDGQAYFSFLRDKQAALGLIGLENSGEGQVLQVKPNLVLAVDTGGSESQALAIARNVLNELSLRFFKENGEIEDRTANGTRWLIITAAGGKKIFSAAAGGVLLVGNNEDAVKKCLEIKQGGGDSLAASAELLRAAERHGAPDRIAFGYVSSAGIRELANYLAISYALKSSETALTREMISGLLPEMLSQTVNSVAWSARAADAGVEDAYFIETEKEFARNISQTIKAAPPSGAADVPGARYLPRDTHSASVYRLEDPQIAWRGMVLSLAAKLDKAYLPLFEQFSGQLLKPYGIDDPELFLSAVDSQIITARLDEDGSQAIVIAKVKDKEKLKSAISETFDTRRSIKVEGLEAAGAAGAKGVEAWASKDGQFYACIIEGTLIIGNEQAALAGVRAFTREPGDTFQVPQSFSGPGAVVTTKQKDDTAVQILSDLAARNNKTAQVSSYVFSETMIEPGGIKRRTLSAFGLLGEMLKQTLE